MHDREALEQFSAPTRAWFTSAFGVPTPAQHQGWRAIGRGEHALILAPTGSGKTLAAFLWALDRLMTAPGQGCRVLYVSPLKALSYDVERNLQAPLFGIAREAERLGVEVPSLRVAIRTGDTPGSERRLLARRPPDILITTPESLYLLLTSQAGRILADVEHVILDEVHAVAGTKRGVHLSLSLERLEELAHRPFQRIGLSATQRPLDELARWLGGQAPVPGDATAALRARPVTIVDAGMRKPLELEIVVPVEDMGYGGSRAVDPPSPSTRAGPGPGGDGDPEVRASIWPAVYPRLLELIRAHCSTLIFVNSRRLAERLAARLNELAAEESGQGAWSGSSSAATFTDGGSGYHSAGAPADVVRAHHGSMAREQRLEIEDALKAGRLPALVATSSMELGIDMGAIDLVIQVEAPTSVASGLQRIGRAGHQVGQPSRGRIFPKFRHDLVVAAVVAQRMHAGLIEATHVPRNALDVLAQQVVAMVAAADGPLPVEQVWAVVRRSYPYADLSSEAFDGVLDMLSGRYPSDEFAELRPRLVWDRVRSTLAARPGALMLAVISGGTIPDRGLFGVFTTEGGRVGELDEEMVYESRVGETFLLGATTWRIVEITRDRVVVVPAPGVPGKMPFWHGDSIGRPYELGQAIGAFVGQLATLSDQQLADDFDLDRLAVGNLRAYVAEEQEATGGLLPTDHQIVVQRFRDEVGDWRVAVLSPFGARVHAPWAMAIEAKMRHRLGVEVRAVWSDDGIILRLPDTDDDGAIPVELLVLAPEEVEDLVVAEVGRSPMFAARFRENAARSLLLPRRRPGSRTPLWQLRQRAAHLLSVAQNYGAFPVLLETYRESLRDVFDLPSLTGLMADIAAQRVRVDAVEVVAPSPFASNLAFAYVAQFMYEGDAPLAERRAQALTLDRRMLGELVGSEELRDLLDAGALARLESELQCLDPERWATSADQAHDLLRRLGDLSPAELEDRCPPGLAATETLLADGRALVVTITGSERLIAAEDAGRYRDGVGVVLGPGLPEAFAEAVPDAAVQLVRRWARTHGPFVLREPAARFGLPLDEVAGVLDDLSRLGRLERGEYRPDGVEREWCDVEVLRVLRQRSLAALRREVEPTDAEALGRFLPAWQGVTAASAPGAAVAIGRGRGSGALYDAISQLQGVALPASVLESEVLAARVTDYSPRLLDELLAAGEVMWVGAGALGRADGRVVLALREQAGLLFSRLGRSGWPAIGGSDDRGSGDVGPNEPVSVAAHIRAVLARRGACFFRELSMAGVDDVQLLDELWNLVWAGEVTNDSVAALRATIAISPRRPSAGSGRGGSARRSGRARPRPGSLSALGPPRGQGRWSLVSRELEALGIDGAGGAGGALGSPDPTRASVALATVLLERYGVLTREAVRAEGVPGGFASIYPVLRAMEESGRIRRGYFIAGLGGAQFALPGAVDRLREVRDRRPSGRAGTASTAANRPLVVILAATDPANPYGLVLPWPVKGPQRVAGARVVLVDGVASLYLERGGRSLGALRDFDGEWEAAAVHALAQGLSDGGRGRLVFNRYPDELGTFLREAQFVPTPKGLVRYA